MALAIVDGALIDLTKEEVKQVSGGMTIFGSIVVYQYGGNQAMAMMGGNGTPDFAAIKYNEAGLGSLVVDGIKWVAANVAWDVLKEAFNRSVGVAGPGGNENDNGGTSFGTGITNTFGYTGSAFDPP